MDYKLEAIALPVTDVDRAKAFYAEQAGFAVDVDHRADDSFRVVQLTPPGSACSVMMGIGITDSVPGAVKGLHLVVTDIEAAHAELAARGVQISTVRHMGSNGWVEGPDPERSDYNSFAEFTDPDGNLWIVQERGHQA
ncbi:MAG TPA: VOC family protein [Jatrophihabitans sp.]|jgi:catechol 2,3-dioxygenase-like lactoylglutathione lyase family enzyme